MFREPITKTDPLPAAAFLADRYGSIGASSGIALAGFADAHSASASAASLALAGTLPPRIAVFTIVLAVSTNTVSKCVAAFSTGGWEYCRALAPGLALMLMAMWVGVWLG